MFRRFKTVDEDGIYKGLVYSLKYLEVEFPEENFLLLNVNANTLCGIARRHIRNIAHNRLAYMGSSFQKYVYQP